MTSGFGFLGVLGWLLLGGLALYIAFVMTQRSQGRPMKFSVLLITGLLLGGIALNTLSNGLVSIPPQERGIVLNLFTGYRAPELQPGVHFITPYVESVKRYNIGQQTYTMARTPAEGQVSGDDSVTARTADGQEVFIDASIVYQVNPDRLIDVFVRYSQDQWQDILVRPQARSIIYNKVAQYRVEEVYSTKRDALQKAIEDEMRVALEANGFLLNSMLLRNVTFNEEYARSVEEKQIAQQNSERARFLVESEKQEAERVRVQAQGRADASVTAAKGEAEANVINARAEAEALSLIAEQLKDNPNLLTYRYIERLAPGVQTIFLPSNQPFLLDPKSFTGPSSTTASAEPAANGAVPTPAPAPTTQPLVPAVEPTPAPTTAPAP
jgi:regulator of protease activity HflC (stomatin/prohibitin superfamily)